MTYQTKVWSGELGKAFTDRHMHSADEWEQLYIDRFGISRTELNTKFIGDLDRNIRILEVGCNMGNQLRVLQGMGFKNLYGIELQEYAVEMAKQRTKGINIIQGSAFDIPFRDNWFDLVYTSGVLIHFELADVPKVMREIVRCTRKYIWGLEYYAKEFTEIEWRGKPNLMWKADYVNIYTRTLPKLNVVKEGIYKYLNEEGDKYDSMFLLEKG